MTSCWFHFCQAVRKNATQDSDLYALIRKDWKASFIYRKFQCLPLLPEKYIKAAFKELRAEAKELDKNAFSNFISYFYKQWIKKEGPAKICVFKRETRTTCAVEANNGVLGRKWKSHASFFVFVEALQKEEFCKSTQLMQDIRTIELTKPRKIREDRLNRIRRASKEIGDDAITPMQFLEKIANLNNRIMQDTPLELDINESFDEVTNPLSSNESDTDDEDYILCVICSINKPNILLQPCLHCCLCGECWSKLERSSKQSKVKCPRRDCSKTVKKHSTVTY